MEILARSSYIRRKDMDSVLNCLVTDRLAPGEYTDKFIKSAREKFGFDYGVAVRSPMVAFQLSCECMGLESGDAIALSALSPLWAYKVIISRGYTPVWLDVDAGSAAVTAESLQKLGEHSVKAIYVAEPWGIMVDPAPFLETGIPIIEDATFVIGMSAGNVSGGSLGTLTLVGLEHGAAITAGGGALLFAKGKRDAQALRNAADGLLPEERMSDMNAALALSQVKDIDRFIEKRRELAALYTQSLARSQKRPLAASFEGEISGFGCVVVLESGVKDARSYAKKKDVDTVLAFDDSCVYAGVVPEGACPIAASLSNRSVAFPLNQRIGKSAAQKIAKVLATLP